MMRDTSLEAYFDNISSGLKAKKEKDVLRALVQFERSTVNELFRAWKGSTTLCQANIGSALYALREKGVVIDDKKRPCKVTGRNAYEWRTTGKAPMKFEKSKGKKCPTCKGSGHITEEQATFLLEH